MVYQYVLIEVRKSFKSVWNVISRQFISDFQGFAVFAVAYVNNSHYVSIDNCTPYYLKHKNHLDLMNLRVFGCDEYTLILRDFPLQA